MSVKDLSIDDLLQVVETKKRSGRKIEDNANVRRYLQETGWEPGTLAIPNYVIYWHYRTKWVCHKSNKTNKIVFFRCFNKRFPSFRKTNQRYYLLKEGIVELTPEVLKEAKHYDKTYFPKKEKKEKV